MLVSSFALVASQLRNPHPAVRRSGKPIWYTKGVDCRKMSRAERCRGANCVVIPRSDGLSQRRFRPINTPSLAHWVSCVVFSNRQQQLSALRQDVNPSLWNCEFTDLCFLNHGTCFFSRYHGTASVRANRPTTATFVACYS